MTAITVLAHADLPRAAATLARAFHDDPIFEWALPDPERRALVLPVFFAAVTRVAMYHNETYTTPDIPGVAVWYPPDPPPATRSQVKESGMLDLPDAFGRDDYERFRAGIDVLEHLHKRDMAQPHWYLGVLGVDPAMQGRGIGSALIAPVLDRADAARLPCYLETEKEINVAFYRRHGFEVIVEDSVADGGPRFWTMVRWPHVEPLKVTLLKGNMEPVTRDS
jgi:ribosomal protein S18 acetylase RimI-like enzyme